MKTATKRRRPVARRHVHRQNPPPRKGALIEVEKRSEGHYFRHPLGHLAGPFRSRVAAQAEGARVFAAALNPNASGAELTELAAALLDEDPERPFVRKFADGWRVWDPARRIFLRGADGAPFATRGEAERRRRELAGEASDDGPMFRRAPPAPVALDLFAPRPARGGGGAPMQQLGLFGARENPARDAARLWFGPDARGAFRVGGRTVRGDVWQYVDVFDQSGRPLGGGAAVTAFPAHGEGPLWLGEAVEDYEPGVLHRATGKVYPRARWRDWEAGEVEVFVAERRANPSAPPLYHPLTEAGVNEAGRIVYAGLQALAAEVPELRVSGRTVKGSGIARRAHHFDLDAPWIPSNPLAPPGPAFAAMVTTDGVWIQSREGRARMPGATPAEQANAAVAGIRAVVMASLRARPRENPSPALGPLRGGDGEAVVYRPRRDGTVIVRASHAGAGSSEREMTLATALEHRARLLRMGYRSNPARAPRSRGVRRLRAPAGVVRWTWIVPAHLDGALLREMQAQGFVYGQPFALARIDEALGAAIAASAAWELSRGTTREIDDLALPGGLAVNDWSDAVLTVEDIDTRPGGLAGATGNARLALDLRPALYRPNPTRRPTKARRASPRRRRARR